MLSLSLSAFSQTQKEKRRAVITHIKTLGEPDLKKVALPVGLGFASLFAYAFNKVNVIRGVGHSLISGKGYEVLLKGKRVLSIDAHGRFLNTNFTFKFAESFEKSVARNRALTKVRLNFINVNNTFDRIEMGKARSHARLARFKNIFGGLAVGFLGVALGDLIAEKLSNPEVPMEEMTDVEIEELTFNAIVDSPITVVNMFFKNNPDITNALYDSL